MRQALILFMFIFISMLATGCAHHYSGLPEKPLSPQHSVFAR